MKLRDFRIRFSYVTSTQCAHQHARSPGLSSNASLNQINDHMSYSNQFKGKVQLAITFAPSRVINDNVIVI